MVATRLIRMMKRVFSLPAAGVAPVCVESTTAIGGPSLENPRARRLVRLAGAARSPGCLRTPALVTSAQQVLVEQVLVTLLLAADLLRLADLRRQRGQVGQAQLAGGEVGTGAAVEAGVTLLAPGLPRRVVEQRVGHFQALGERVHATDVGDEQVFHVGGLAARLGV